MSIETQIAENYQRILDRAASAARRGQRSPDDLRVVAVTKYVSAEWTQLLAEAGCQDMGESRPQQLWDKSQRLAHWPDLRWHMIGHLQRNKVDRTLLCGSKIHSVDSPRLMHAIEAAACKLHLAPVSALLEINISGEIQKHGLQPKELPAVIDLLTEMHHVAIGGLMGMASPVDDERELRAQFRSLRDLRDKYHSTMPPGHALRELSMGMSGDFELAIEEGATLVRVGSALFEGCQEQ